MRVSGRDARTHAHITAVSYPAHLDFMCPPSEPFYLYFRCPAWIHLWSNTQADKPKPNAMLSLPTRLLHTKPQNGRRKDDGLCRHIKAPVTGEGGGGGAAVLYQNRRKTLPYHSLHFAHVLIWKINSENLLLTKISKGAQHILNEPNPQDTVVSFQSNDQMHFLSDTKRQGEDKSQGLDNAFKCSSLNSLH